MINLICYKVLENNYHNHWNQNFKLANKKIPNETNLLKN